MVFYCKFTFAVPMYQHSGVHTRSIPFLGIVPPTALSSVGPGSPAQYCPNLQGINSILQYASTVHKSWLTDPADAYVGTLTAYRSGAAYYL